METKKIEKKYCHFCGETKPEMLYNRGGKKVCSLCIKIILETITDYANQK